MFTQVSVLHKQQLWLQRLQREVEQQEHHQTIVMMLPVRGLLTLY
jgi:hypothetical protein